MGFAVGGGGWWGQQLRPPEPETATVATKPTSDPAIRRRTDRTPASGVVGWLGRWLEQLVVGFNVGREAGWDHTASAAAAVGALWEQVTGWSGGTIRMGCWMQLAIALTAMPLQRHAACLETAAATATLPHRHTTITTNCRCCLPHRHRTPTTLRVFITAHATPNTAET